MKEFLAGILMTITGATSPTVSPTVSTTISSGGQDGSGGGGICINNKCRTLAEAGLRIQPEGKEAQIRPKYWAPTLQAMKELDTIRKRVPGGFIGYQAEGKYQTFVVVDSIDDKKFAKVLNEYQKILIEQKFDQSSGSLEIFAVSTQGVEQKTYLLPAFFNLTPYRQALILIHEARIRNGADLKEVLEQDGLLVDFLNGKDVREYDYLKFLHYAFPDEKRAFADVVRYLEVVFGRRLTLADFRDDLKFSETNYRRDKEIEHDWAGRTLLKEPMREIGALALIRSSEIYPRFAEIFAGPSEDTKGWRMVTQFEKGQFGQLGGVPSPIPKEVCPSHQHTGGTDRFVVMPVDLEIVMAFDCTRKDDRGNYLGLEISMDGLSLLSSN